MVPVKEKPLTIVYHVHHQEEHLTQILINVFVMKDYIKMNKEDVNHVTSHVLLVIVLINVKPVQMEDQKLTDYVNVTPVLSMI